MKKFLSVSLRLVLISSLLMVLNFKASAQDVIVKKSGEEINAKVEQVSDTEIKYRKADNPSGPVYSVSKSEVFMIKYANGTKDVFSNQTAPVAVPPTTQSKPAFSQNDLMHAKKASTLGYILVAPILGLGITAGAIQDNPGVTIPIGAVATLVAGVGIPIVASGAGKTRRATGVEGNPGMRLAGWIGYGFTIVDALTLIGIASSGGTVPSGLTYSVAVLGAASSVLMAVEAGQVHSQSSALMIHATISPTFGTYRDLYGNNYRTVGIRINF
jgi:hypothetical protein